MRIVPLLVVLALAPTLYAQVKNPDIKYTEQAQPPPADAPIRLGVGQLFVISHGAKLTVVESPEGGVLITEKAGTAQVFARFTSGAADKYEWREFGDKFNWFIQAGKPGRCEVIIVKESGERVRKLFDVSGPSPDPKPDPIPKPPDPIPPTPTDKLGFATMAKVEAQKLPPEQLKHCAALAANFEATAAKLATGTLKGPDEANAELRDKNRATLGADRTAWLPWFTAWQARADASLKTNADYVQAYRDTATGLRQAIK